MDKLDLNRFFFMIKKITAVNIVELLATVEMEIDPTSLDLDVPLVQQGLDSLDMMSILFQFEDAYSIRIGEDVDVAKWATINMMVNNINDILQNS